MFSINVTSSISHLYAQFFCWKTPIPPRWKFHATPLYLLFGHRDCRTTIPPLLSVFYQRLLMSHFSIGGIIILFFCIDLLLLLMFAVIWGNSWPPGTKRLSFSCLWGLNCVLHLCWLTLTTNCASFWHPITVWLCAFFHTQFCKFITCDCQCKPCMFLKCLYLVF